MPRGPKMKGKPEKAKNFWGTTKRLLAYMNYFPNCHSEDFREGDD